MGELFMLTCLSSGASLSKWINFLKETPSAFRMDRQKNNIVESNSDEFIPTRQTLLSRLKDWNDQDSWKDFFDTYWNLIYRTARRSGVTDTESQDVVQETIVSVAKAMPGFKYDGSFGSFKKWLLQLTGWRITDQLRKRRPGDSGSKLRACDADETTAL